MGAANVAAAFQTYARVLRDHDKAMRVLVYMANVARDDDPAPWFGLGHAALAEHALGRDADADGEVGATDLRAVRRAITTLMKVGAITVTRKPNGRRPDHKTVRYRLHLLAPSTVADDSQDRHEPVADDSRDRREPVASEDDRRTLSGRTVGRSVVHRRTLSGSPWDAQRPPEEYEEYEERVEEEWVTSQGDVTTRAHASRQLDEINLSEEDEQATNGPDVTVTRDRDARAAALAELSKLFNRPPVDEQRPPVDEQPVTTTVLQAGSCPDCGVYLDPDGSCFVCAMGRMSA